MHKDHIESGDAAEPTPDPRLVIPEVLREPVKKPDYDPLSGGNGSPSREDVRGMGRAWGIAMDFVFTIVAGLLLGWGFDKWRGTAPWGVLGGLVVGFTAAFVVIVRQAAKEDRMEKARKAAQRTPRQSSVKS